MVQLWFPLQHHFFSSTPQHQYIPDACDGASLYVSEWRSVHEPRYACVYDCVHDCGCACDCEHGHWNDRGRGCGTLYVYGGVYELRDDRVGGCDGRCWKFQFGKSLHPHLYLFLSLVCGMVFASWKVLFLIYHLLVVSYGVFWDVSYWTAVVLLSWGLSVFWI